jgi:hypothetical protein
VQGEAELTVDGEYAEIHGIEMTTIARVQYRVPRQTSDSKACAP